MTVSTTSSLVQPRLSAAFIVHAELRRSGAERRQRRDRSNLARLEIEPRSGADIAKRELDDKAGEIRGDVLERCKDAGALLTVERVEQVQAAAIAIVQLGVLLRLERSQCRHADKQSRHCGASESDADNTTQAA